MNPIRSDLAVTSLLSFTSAVTLCAAPTFAAVVTFEDVTTQAYPASASIASAGWITDYAGFAWRGASGNSNPWYAPYSVGVYTPGAVATGYEYGVTSGTHAAYSSWGAEVSVSRQERWNFDGAYFNAAWNTGLMIRLVGLRGGATVYDTTTTLGAPTAATWIGAGFTDIDELRMTASGGSSYGFPNGSGTNFTFDDFTYRAGGIPAAGTLALVSAAGFTSRRPRNRR
jgi:hypothetical protein